MAIEITYCPPNISFTEIWMNHGMSKCFMDTVSITIISLYLMIFGTIQLWMYHKYGTEINANVLPRSKLYNLQKFFLYLVPLLSALRIILQATVLDDKKIYGYMVSYNLSHFYIVYI